MTSATSVKTKIVAAVGVRTKLLAAVAKWAVPYEDQGRRHLCMVRFGDGEMVACDGCRLVRVPLDTHGCKPFGILPMDIAAIAAAQRELPKFQHRGELDITLCDDTVEIALAEQMVVRVEALEAGAYPQIDQIMPTRCETADPPGYTFDPKFLAAIHEVNSAAGAFESRGVRCTAWSKIDEQGYGGPMMFTGDFGIRFVVMPMRGTGG